MFEKRILATEFAGALATFVHSSHHEAQAILATLNDVFPWLDNFHIERDGSDFRWLATNRLVEDSDIVFSQLHKAKEQIESWVIEYVDGQRGDAPDLLAALESLKHIDGCFCEAAFAGPGTTVRHAEECVAACAAIEKARQ